MTDHERRQDTEPAPLRRIDRRTNGEIGPTERLAMNRTGSFDWDLDARTLDIDDAGLAVFGVDPASFDSRPGALVERLEPAERARLDVTIDEAITGGSNSYNVHFRVPLDDGTTQWTHVQARILRSKDGKAHRIVGVVRDATAEVTHSAFVLDLEKRRQRQTNIVERTTSAMSRAVTVDAGARGRARRARTPKVHRWGWRSALGVCVPGVSDGVDSVGVGCGGGGLGRSSALGVGSSSHASTDFSSSNECLPPSLGVLDVQSRRSSGPECSGRVSFVLNSRPNCLGGQQVLRRPQ
ncbi:hypothetical protein SMICM17S_02204 [Streptomyces microflavus]